MKRFFCSLLESSLLELYFFLKSASLNVRKQEWLNQISDECFIIVKSSFITFQRLIHFLFSQVSHDACLSVRCSLYSIIYDPVQVTVDSSLIHFYDFFIKTLLTSSDNFFSISAAGLFNLALSSFFFRLFNFLTNTLLFSVSDKFLWQFIKSLSNDLSLKSFIHGISKFLLVFFQKNFLSLTFRKIRDFSYDKQLFD